MIFPCRNVLALIRAALVPEGFDVDDTPNCPLGNEVPGGPDWPMTIFVRDDRPCGIVHVVQRNDGEPGFVVYDELSPRLRAGARHRIVWVLEDLFNSGPLPRHVRRRAAPV